MFGRNIIRLISIALNRKETNMYIARDKDGDLYLYKDHPIKCSESWQPSKTSNDWIKLYPSLFPEVKWEDEEPTEVELVKKKGYNI